MASAFLLKTNNEDWTHLFSCNYGPADANGCILPTRIGGQNEQAIPGKNLNSRGTRKFGGHGDCEQCTPCEEDDLGSARHGEEMVEKSPRSSGAANLCLGMYYAVAA